MTELPGGLRPYVRRHLRLGWWTLFLFLALGLGLAALRAAQAPCYLHPANATRRLMWTLAHTHGTLVALLHLVYGAALQLVPRVATAPPRVTSAALTAAGVALPGGFFLGGVWFHGGDPGLGILAVPVGALCLLAAVGGIARAR